MFIFRRKHIKILQKDIIFYSHRYMKITTAKAGFKYDGASGVPDVDDEDGALHDWNFFVARWDDGTPMTFEEANNNYTDWLAEKANRADKRLDRAIYRTVSVTRRALYVVGRKAWSEHRRREMMFDNMKFTYALRGKKEKP